MSDINVVIEDEDIFKTTIQEEDQTLGQTSAYTGSATSVAELNDVDVSILKDGSVLVFKAQTNRWTSTTILDKQDVEGGEF